MTSKRWTSDEVNTLVECVNNNPHLLKKAFSECSEATGRTPSACAVKWYSIAGKDTTKTCFALVTSKTKVKNKKNPKKEQNFQSITCRLWKRIVTLLGF